MRGAVAVVVVRVAAVGCGLEVDGGLKRNGPVVAFLPSSVGFQAGLEVSKAVIVTRVVSRTCFQQLGSRISRG